ncbi:hypothetical protein Bca101_059846 [Brassica carinata]
MLPKSRPSREEKGKAVAVLLDPTKGVTASGSPLDDFDLVHRDAMRDTENMAMAQRLLVADAHRQIREERASSKANNVDSDREGMGSSREDYGSDRSEASAQTPRPSRRLHGGTRFDRLDFRPTVYHPGGIFEELSPLSPGMLRDP